MIPMSTFEEPTPDESGLDAKARSQKAFDILRDIFTKHNLTPEEAKEVMDQMAAGAKIVQEAKMDYPFTDRETMVTLFEPMTHSWLHPLVNLAHKLLRHHQIVVDPFMIGGIDRETEGGPSKGVVCSCFYATVRFKEDDIKVYSNWDRGGMCPEDVEFLVAIHPTPDYIKKLLPQLEAIAEEQLSEGCKEYDVPKRVRLKRPAHDHSGLEM